MTQVRHGLTHRLSERVMMGVDPSVAGAQAAGTITAPLGTSGNPSHRVLTAANAITMLRLVLTVVFLVLFVRHINRTLALACYAVAAATDFLDGQVARRTQTVSWLGKVMDPVMDRVLLFTGVLALLVTGELPLWTAVFVIGRDVYLLIGGMMLQRYRKRPVDVAYVGKAATAVLMTGFVLMLLKWPPLAALHLVRAVWLPGINGTDSCVGVLFVYLGCVLSFITAVVYTRTGLTIRRKCLESQGGGSR
ncbi:cardiolipin synthase [Olsenella profusa DSM 13989]|uniref:CDP-alcohol phosphatidyltransferase n=1 Tax=Olsenella profusa F0195 TaxID=1125712 RepID=U2TK01_9ACTN|nr:CDP-alcohol phosphatidyltransferase family protein [Olsenella profusa]ERL06528.1 CDP-alcohol phosphatidyltransferase [Olsenella profusa F0195]MDP9860328.1 cardiolipin synthase [Olsenella profusa DSM 13989]